MRARQGEHRTLFLSTAAKSYQFKFKYGSGCAMFQSALLVGIETAIELNRTAYGLLRYDLSSLYCPDWKPRLEQYLKLVSSRYTYAKTLADFGKEFAKLVGEFGLIADAFYAAQPFCLPLFRAFACRFIAIVRSKLQKMWNEHFDALGAGDCMGLSDSITLFLGTLEKWGIREDGLRAYYQPLVLKFTQCLFLNSREILANIMDQILNTRNVVQGKVKCAAFANLEGHIFFVLDHYSKFPSAFFAEEIAHYISALLPHFLGRIRYLLDANQTSPRLFIMLLNANMVKVVRNAEKKLVDLAGKHLKLPAVRDIFGEMYLLKRIFRIFTEANRLLRAYFKNQVILPCFARHVPFLEFDFRKQVDKVIFEANNHLTLLANENLLRESFQFVFERTFKGFARFYMRQVSGFLQSEFVVSAAKAKADLGYLRNFCIDDILENGYLMRKHIDAFADVLTAGDVSAIIVGFINLQVSFPKVFNAKNVNKLIKARMNEEKALRNYVKKHIQRDDVQEHFEGQMMFQLKKRLLSGAAPLFVLYFFLVLGDLISEESYPPTPYDQGTAGH